MPPLYSAFAGIPPHGFSNLREFGYGRFLEGLHCPESGDVFRVRGVRRWAPVLAARLLGPLKMSGKQTGWIYTTLPIACIVSPLVAGQLADRYFDLKWIVAVAHLVAAALMFFAVRQKTFGSLFAAMFGWSLCYAGTMPLVNAALFAHMKEFATMFPSMKDVSGTVFIWAPIGWAIVGYSLSGWRMLPQRRERRLRRHDSRRSSWRCHGDLLLALARNGAGQ